MTYIPRLSPRAHQVEYVRRAAGRTAFAALADMGCVDADTEYLSPTGWQRIADWDGGKVAQFCLDGTADFVRPLAYVRRPVDKFVRFVSARGIDQVLSAGHRILYCAGRSVSQIVAKHVGRVPPGYRDMERSYTAHWWETTPADKGDFLLRVPTHFNLKGGTGIPLSNEQIRLHVAFHADGLYGRRDLTKVGAKRRFMPFQKSKTFQPSWWKATVAQRRLIAEEVLNWDGQRRRAGGCSYSSIHKSDADFVQWCYVSTGRRAALLLRSDGTWAVGVGRSNNLANMMSGVPYESPDGMMYCFHVPSTYLVLRRNGRVFVTGNTGKTKSVLDEWGTLWDASECRDLLLIAPAGCVRNWDLDRGPAEPGELRKHLDPAMHERLVAAPVVSGATAGQRAAVAAVLRSADPGVARFLSVNVEALSSVPAARAACEQFLTARPGAMIVVDEATTIANSESARSRWVKHLGGMAARRRILTGLPSPDSPLQLYGQFDFLDWRILGHRTWWGFRKTYAVEREIVVGGEREDVYVDAVEGAAATEAGEDVYWTNWDASGAPSEGVYSRVTGGRPTKIIVGYRDVEDLAAKIAPHSFRVRKEDCLDLPPKTYLSRDVALTTEQARVYREVRENATARLSSGDHVTAANVAVQMMRLQQVVCGHVRDEGGRVHAVPSNRVRDLLEVLGGHAGKAVVWAGFDHSIREIAEALTREYGDGSVARFWGGNVSTRLREEAMWKQDPRCRFMVATQAAGGQGNTWVAANLAVYYSNTSSARERLQSEDRTHRDGMTAPCTYLDLVARGTVDERLLVSARRKISLADLVAGDDPRRWLI